MKTLLAISQGVLLGLFCGCISCTRRPAVQTSLARPTDRAFKGVELYSWKQDGDWLFALLPGTNGMKPEPVVKAGGLRLSELERRFAGCAEGESIYWLMENGFERPEPAIVKQVQMAAGRSKVILSVP